MHKKEDFDRIAKQMGDDAPDKLPVHSEEQENPAEEYQRAKNLEIKEKLRQEPMKEIPKIKKEFTNIKIRTGFVFGLLFALGFWLITLIVYFALKYSGQLP